MSEKPGRHALVVAVVGPSASGKSTLIRTLKAAGYHPRHVAQEHSYVADMWQRITRPDVLIYLDVSYEQSRQRRPDVQWGPERRQKEVVRLTHAHQHCDLYVHTDTLSPEEVQAQVLAFLDAWSNK